ASLNVGSLHSRKLWADNQAEGPVSSARYEDKELIPHVRARRHEFHALVPIAAPLRTGSSGREVGSGARGRESRAPRKRIYGHGYDARYWSAGAGWAGHTGGWGHHQPAGRLVDSQAA